MVKRQKASRNQSPKSKYVEKKSDQNKYNGNFQHQDTQLTEFKIHCSKFEKIRKHFAGMEENHLRKNDTETLDFKPSRRKDMLIGGKKRTSNYCK